MELVRLLESLIGLGGSDLHEHHRTLAHKRPYVPCVSPH